MNGEEVPILPSTEPETEPHATVSAFIGRSNIDSQDLPEIGSAKLAESVVKW